MDTSRAGAAPQAPRPSSATYRGAPGSAPAEARPAVTAARGFCPQFGAAARVLAAGGLDALALALSTFGQDASVRPAPPPPAAARPLEPLSWRPPPPPPPRTNWTRLVGAGRGVSS